MWNIFLEKLAFNIYNFVYEDFIFHRKPSIWNEMANRFCLFFFNNYYKCNPYPYWI